MRSTASSITDDVLRNGSGRKPVLVLDGETTSALAVVRSLGRQRLAVEVGSSVSHPIAGLSKYCDGHSVYPDPLFDARGFGIALLELLQRRAYALVIPVTDRTIWPLMEIRESVEALSPLAMSSNEAQAAALSKERTYQLARRLGIPTAKTVVVASSEALGPVEDQLGYPVVVRPDRSKTGFANGTGRNSAVTYAFDARQLRESVRRLLPAGVALLQEYVRGEGVAIGLLVSKGQTRVAFQYRRLHEVPVSGGASSYRVSEALSPVLLGYASALMKELEWNGVAMVEFKVDRWSGGSHLIGVKGHFWGSLALAVAAGADFPAYLFDLWVRQRQDFPRDYRIGVRSRDLSRELEWLKEMVFGRQGGETVTRCPGYREILWDLLRLLDPAEHWDAMDRRDPHPGFHQLRALARQVIEGGWNKLGHVRERRRVGRVRSNPKSLIGRLRRARTILMVCQGNVIRSVFAAHYLTAAVGPRPVAIRSAGLDAAPGGPAHRHAVAKARAFGLDLSGHRAVRLTREMVASADVIFVMEVSQLVRLRRQFSRVRRKAFVLGCLAPETPLEIPDPVGKDEVAFEACCDHIVGALRPIIRLVGGDDERAPGRESLRVRAEKGRGAAGL